MTEIYAMALLNGLLCSSIIFISICRLNVMRGCVLYRVRSQYALYVGAAVFSGLQPWWGYWPSYSAISMAAAMLFGLFCDSGQWHGGAPPAASMPGELRHADGTALGAKSPDPTNKRSVTL